MKPLKPTPRPGESRFVQELKRSVAWLYEQVENNRIQGDGATFSVTQTANGRVGHAIGSGTGTFDHPFRVYLDGGNIKVTAGKAFFWNGDTWVTSTLSEDGSNTWGSLTSEQVYVQLDLSGVSPSWSLGHAAVGIQASDDQETRTWILASIDGSGNITQEVMGAIYETLGG